MAGCIKKHHIMAFLIAFTCLLCACQPTPTPASASASPEPSAMPTDTATEYINSGDTLKTATPLRDGITLEVDAEVKLPEKPLVTGKVKRYSFDMEQVKAVAQVLFGDAPLYQYVETKSELVLFGSTYLTEIEMARDILPDSEIEFLTNIADQINGAIAAAPETKPSAELDKISTYDGMIVQLEAGRERYATFYADMGTYRQLIEFSNVGYKRFLVEEIPLLAISRDEAVAQAFDVLEQMGLSELFAVVNTYKRPINHTLVETSLDEQGYSFPSRHEVQGVILMRKINGEAPIFSRQVDNGATAGEFGAAIFWEKIRMEFDNEGLVWFVWNEPGDVEVTEGDVAVIDLDAAYAKLYDHLMKSQTRYTYEDYGLDSQDITIKIDRIELSMTYTAGANGAILVLPIWDFYGQIVCQTENGPLYVDTLYRTTSAQPLENNSICTLNAITGEFMDRGLR